MKLSLLLIPLLLTTNLYADDNDKKPEDPTTKFNLSVTGFIRSDAYFATRLGYELSNDATYYIAPLPAIRDDQNIDINAAPLSSAANLIPTLALAATGPRFLGASVDGYLQAQFFGYFFASGSAILQNAFIQAAWENDSLLFGQAWHPLIMPEVFPNTVSLTYGVPIATEGRFPQIRYRHKFKSNVYVTSALVGVYQYGIDGPNPFPENYSPLYIRNGLSPLGCLRIEYRDEQFELGIGAYAFRFIPRLATTVNAAGVFPEVPVVATGEKLWSGETILYGALWKDKFTARAQVYYGSNGTLLSQLGGYGVTTQNPTTGLRDYANIYFTGFWNDINLLGFSSRFQPGLFFGYTKQLGSHQQLFINPSTGRPIIYSSDSLFVEASAEIGNLGAGVDQYLVGLARIAPRIWIYLEEYLAFGLELSFFYAEFGRLNDFAKPIQKNPVKSLYCAFSTQYQF